VKALRVGLAVSIVTTALAGLYVVVYLYRWEMHRALVAGVVFLAGEIALATSLVLRRIEQLQAPAPATSEHVLATAPVVPTDPVLPTDAGAPVLAEDPAATALPGDPFAPVAPPRPQSPPSLPWLGGDRFGVFVPILLGAGAIVSGVAWVVEHLSRATVGSRQAGHVERHLAGLAPPPVGFLAPGPEAPAARPAPRPAAPLGRFGQAAVGLMVGGLVAALLTLALLGRSRPDPPTSGMRSILTFEVGTRNGLDPDLAAESLWGACHPSAAAHDAVELTVVGPATYRLVLEPALGAQAERRLRGCMTDGTLEQVHADIRAHERVPAPS
jgi:hypothetical protein